MYEQSKELSSNYRLVTPTDIESYLRPYNWTLDSIVQQRKRKKKGPIIENAPYEGRYVMRFNHPSFTTPEERFQLIVINSNDGSTSVQFRIGIYRMICSNGLIAGTNIFTTLRVRHVGEDMETRIKEEIKALQESMTNFMYKIDRMKEKVLTEGQIKDLFFKASLLRFPDNTEIPRFQSQRPADDGTDLYTIYNVVQEYLIRGGFYLNKKKVRALKSPLTQIEVNNGLSNLMEAYL